MASPTALSEKLHNPSFVRTFETLKQLLVVLCAYGCAQMLGRATQPLTGVVAVAAGRQSTGPHVRYAGYGEQDSKAARNGVALRTAGGLNVRTQLTMQKRFPKPYHPNSLT